MATTNKKYIAKTAEEKQREIDELSNRMTEQISHYFVSEATLKEHLAFMSNFYSYSLRNMALIQSQFAGAKAVGSFNFWKDKGVSVKKGEKGIQLFVPTPVEYFQRDGGWVRVQSANMVEKAQIQNGTLETQKKLFFKIGHVFEYTQTDAREKNMPISEIFAQYHQEGVMENEKEMSEALHKIAEKLEFEILPEPIEELGVAKGAAYPYLKKIALNPRNTAYENVTTLLHELAHAKLHTPDVRDSFTKAEREFQAEMVAYVVANRYGIDTEDFSLSYLAGWTQQGKNIEDKVMLLNGVREAAHEFIEIIDGHLQEIELSKGNVLNQSTEALHHEQQDELVNSIYYPIDEEAARRAKEANSFSDYNEGSATANYRQAVDAAVKIAEKQKAEVDSSFHEKIDILLDTYSRKLAQNLNNRYVIDARVPSLMIVGGGNFPTRKKEKQNAARDKNMEEWREIQGLLDKIQSTGRGGISADDPEAIHKLEAKLTSLVKLQETMKATNAYYRKHKTMDGCPHLPKSEVENLKVAMESNWRSDPKPFEAFQLSNNNAEIRRLKERIQTLKENKEKDYAGWSFEGGKVEANKEENRLQIFFDDKPNEQTRTDLKSRGFRWSSKNGAWQRQLTDNAVHAVRKIASLQPIVEGQAQNKGQGAVHEPSWLLVRYGALSEAKLHVISENDLKNEVITLVQNQIEEWEQMAKENNWGLSPSVDRWKNYHEKLLSFSQVDEVFVQFVSETFQDDFTLIPKFAVQTPQILIQWSEESALRSNELMEFAKGNLRMSQLEKEIHYREKQYSYCKTRYHVLIPNENGEIDLVNPDRWDLGCGDYKSVYDQLLAEKKLTPTQHNQLLETMAVYEEIKPKEAKVKKIVGNER
ncbi:LPD25 domain-containing protein [Metasolibacillus sp.]|uniref:LPD25 domain-containing protein n=1 Tax=Metasolibacillus sp. TaxID=2703680 RepID=UPI0025F966DF|nr:LPD25 domain-containing protein [Metasolibacillus sp.]MCT6922829.1 ArdC-like ssDNA-binding domain-containing protein [Metasolibacillus sp.]MCT6938832.1 ArdC-like ssDNA-binding domain-containing protein [Metasolibacillus sp.]